MDYYCQYCGQKFTNKRSILPHEHRCKNDIITKDVLQERLSKRKLTTEDRNSLEAQAQFHKDKYKESPKKKYIK